jgi:hypothetical protein
MTRAIAALVAATTLGLAAAAAAEPLTLRVGQVRAAGVQ